MTKTFGILAHPAGHSLSPAIHNAGFQALNIDAEYLMFDIPPEELDYFFQRVRKEKIGLSVSIPHKESVIKYCDELSDAAKAIGAVNTLYWRGEKLIGDNTDYLGVLYPLMHSIKSIKLESCKVRKLEGQKVGKLEITKVVGLKKGVTLSLSKCAEKKSNVVLRQAQDDILPGTTRFKEMEEFLKNKNIVILGAGGASRAAVYACLLEGANVIVLNRTEEKARSLVKDFENSGVLNMDSRLRGNDKRAQVQNSFKNYKAYENSKLSYGSLSTYEKKKTDIIIQTTSVGMMSKESLLDEGDFCDGQIAFDIVYRPRITQFLKNAKKSGAHIILGEEMFLQQAYDQFYLFTGKKAPFEEMGEVFNKFF